jgi:hypothetical protein
MLQDAPVNPSLEGSTATVLVADGPSAFTCKTD